MTRAFISYSRKDEEDVREFTLLLEKRGIEVLVDTRDVSVAEDWRTRLKELIISADAVLLFVSHQFLQSEVCHWELKQSLRLEKRLVPIKIGAIETNTIPAELVRINFLESASVSDAVSKVDEVAHAILVNIEWVREHTRLTNIAERWESSGRPADHFLRGREIASAEAWRDAKPASAPKPTASVLSLISLSRQAQVRRLRRGLVLSTTAVCLTVGLAIFALYQRDLAIRKADEASANLADARIALSRQEFFYNQPIAATSLALSALSLTTPDSPKNRTEVITELGKYLDELKEKRRHKFESQIWAAGLYGDRTKIALTVDDKIKLIDVATLEVVGELSQNKEKLQNVRVSENGRKLVASSRAGFVAVWDLNSETIISSFNDYPEQRNYSRALDVNRDGSLVAYGFNNSDRSELVVKAVGNSLPENILSVEYPSELQVVEFSGDSSFLFAGDRSGKIQAWELATGHLAFEVTAHESDVTAISVSPSGHWLASSGLSSDKLSGSIKLWSAQSGQLVSEIGGHRGGVVNLTFSDDEKLLLSSSRDLTNSVWDISQRFRIGSLLGHLGTPTRAFFLPGNEIVTTGADGTLRVWDSSQIIGIARRDFEQPIWSVVFSPDASQVLVGMGDQKIGGDGSARIIEAQSGKELQSFSHPAPVFVADFSPNGELSLTASTDGIIKLWNNATGEVLQSVGTGFGPVPYVGKFDPTGRSVVLGLEDAVVTFGVPDLEILEVFKLKDQVTALEVSEDGRKIFAGTDQGSVFRIDRETGMGLQFEAIDSRVKALSYSAADNEVLALHFDGTVSISQFLRTVKGTTRSSDAYFFGFADVSQVKNRFIGRGPTGSPVIVNGRTREVVGSLADGLEDIRVAAFSNDGELIATGSYDGILKVWRPSVPEGDLWDVACARIAFLRQELEEESNSGISFSSICETSR